MWTLKHVSPTCVGVGMEEKGWENVDKEKRKNKVKSETGHVFLWKTLWEAKLYRFPYYRTFQSLEIMTIVIYKSLFVNKTSLFSFLYFRFNCWHLGGKKYSIGYSWGYWGDIEYEYSRWVIESDSLKSYSDSFNNITFIIMKSNELSYIKSLDQCLAYKNIW